MVGQNIGKYRVLERVGRGGMGTVYRATDETLNREVAIKVLNAELNDPEISKRFHAEAITVARLSHPGIATIYELFQHEGQWLMVMEFVRGETLERLVERLGALQAERSAELCMQALSALAHAHSMGVVHRDLKPANMMVTETGGVKLMDFGIARVSGTEHMTNVGFMMGTPSYMAPEQVMGHEIDARADLYAMGVVFYRLTTARLPFKGETPFAMAQSQVNDPPTPIMTVRGDLPVWVEPVVTRALSKKPDDRFQSALEFHEALSRSLAGLQPAVTLYASSAPTEMMMTPPRAMPTVAMPRGGMTPAASASVPLSSARGAIPVQAAAPAGETPPAVPVRTPAPMPAAVVPIAASTPAAPAAAQPVVLPQKPPAATERSPTAIIAVVGAVILLAGIGGAFWYRSERQVSPPQAAVPPPTAAPDAGPSAAASAPPPADALSSQFAAAASPDKAASQTAAATAPAATKPATDARASALPAAAATATNAASPAPVEEARSFSNVKILNVNGRKTSDEDVTLNFAAGQLAVIDKKSGAALVNVPYKTISHATYVHARNPRWDKSLASPPDNLDVGGVLRTSKHWVVLQNADNFWVLRVDGDDNLKSVLDAITARAKVTIDRPNSNDNKNDN